jgi:hypothetical protein
VIVGKGSREIGDGGYGRRLAKSSSYPARTITREKFIFERVMGGMLRKGTRFLSLTFRVCFECGECARSRVAIRGYSEEIMGHGRVMEDGPSLALHFNPPSSSSSFTRRKKSMGVK